MAGARPAATFSRVAPQVHALSAGRRFGRIYPSRHTDPLGYGKTRSRFGDPRRRKQENRFGVLYLGETLKVCFLEAVLRDQRDGVVGNLPIGMDELRMRRYAEVVIEQPLRLFDLREDHAVVVVVPTDVVKASSHTLARRWAVAFYDHPAELDGIIYPSRLNGHANLAVYDRAIAKLRTAKVVSLFGADGLAHVLTDLQVAIVTPDPPA